MCLVIQLLFLLRQLIALRSALQQGPATDVQETMPMVFESPPATADLTGQSGVATTVGEDNRGVLRRALVNEFNGTDSQG